MEQVKLTISRELYQILYDSGILEKGNHTVSDIEKPLQRPYTREYVELKKASNTAYRKLKQFEHTLKQR